MTITYTTAIRIADFVEKEVSFEFEYRLTKEDLIEFASSIGFENVQAYLESIAPKEEDEIQDCMANYEKGYLQDFEYYIHHSKEQEKELKKFLCYRYEKEITTWLINNLGHWYDIPYVWLNDIIER